MLCKKSPTQRKKTLIFANYNLLQGMVNKKLKCIDVVKDLMYSMFDNEMLVGELLSFYIDETNMKQLASFDYQGLQS